MTNLVVLPMLTVSGLWNKLTDMPAWTRWLQYLSPFRYGLHLFIINEYRDEKFEWK